MEYILSSNDHKLKNNLISKKEYTSLLNKINKSY